MALTRKMLKAMGIEDEKIEQIIEAHAETVEALKEKATTYEADAKKLQGVQTELDDLKQSGGEWQKKYEKEHADFEAFKADQTKKETAAAKEKAYRALLKEAGVFEKRIDAIVKITDISGFELDENGKIKDAKSVTDSIKTEYADFIVTTSERGAGAATPPPRQNDGDVMTKEKIYEMKDGKYVLSASQRQAELAKIYQNEKGV